MWDLWTYMHAVMAAQAAWSGLGRCSLLHTPVWFVHAWKSCVDGQGDAVGLPCWHCYGLGCVPGSRRSGAWEGHAHLRV
jgi:hypothetical protein